MLHRASQEQKTGVRGMFWPESLLGFLQEDKAGRGEQFRIG